MSLGVADEQDRAQLRALAHPIRLRMLSLLTASALTAAEIARELELTHANASYHLRQLHAAQVIDIVGEERIHGGIAKRYRHHSSTGDDRPKTTPADRRPTREHLLVYAAMAAELQRRAATMRRGPHNHLTDAELWIDPSAWAGIRDQIEAASDELHRLAVPPRTSGSIRVNATIALFEMRSDQ